MITPIVEEISVHSEALDNFGLSCNKSLQLKDKTTGEGYEMGWWDLARWHPYCLRPEELRILIEYL